MNTAAWSEFTWIDRIQRIFRDADAFLDAYAWADAVPLKGDGRAVSVDAAIAGVHFPWPIRRPADAGYRSLAAAVSDLAAVGAEPDCFLMSATLPPGEEIAPLARYFEGMAAGAAQWRIPLAGGNLSRGPLSVHLTVFGRSGTDGFGYRGPVAPGDQLWLTGTQGDAALALALGVDEDPADGDVATVLDRFWHPSPRLAWGRALAARSWVSGSIDISDGWLRDLSSLVRTAGLGLELDPKRIPRSEAWRRVTGRDAGLLEAAYWGGEDYELGIATRGVSADAVRAAVRKSGVSIVHVGQVGSAGIRWTRPPEVAPPEALGYDPYLD